MKGAMKRDTRTSLLLVIAVSCLGFGGCASDDSSSTNPDAAAYAVFGQTLNNAIPAGLKTGGANSESAALFKEELSGSCSTDYTDCPFITASGGGDSTAGEILLRLWALDYEDECTTELIEAGTCFDCEDCQTGSVGTTNFIMPTMLADPTACANISTTEARYVNMGVDPCFFDTIISQISNIAECEMVAGGAVDISSAVPWYASWEIPQTVEFSSYYSQESGGGVWWTVNSGASGNMQYFLSLDSNWLYAGIKDSVNDVFMFFGSGSPEYYAGRGEGSGVNISAYAGTLSAIPAEFEAIQVRVQDPNNYIKRVKSNGSHLWSQSWDGDDFPATPDAAAAVKDSPSDSRCVEIGTNVVSSKYVPLADCVASFGATDVEALNQDSGFTLKIIDGQTASSISFSTALTPTTETSCLVEESPGG